MQNETIVDILHDYLEDCRSGNKIDQKKFASRIHQLHASEEKIHELLIEMDDEWTREKLMLIKTKNAKPMMIIGIIVALGVAISTLILAMNGAVKTRVSILPYGLVGGGILISMKGYFNLKYIKQYERRRILKWENW